MSTLPSVLFVSCVEGEPPENLIKLMLEKLPNGINSEEGIVSYPWHIDTKYYETDVLLSSMKTKVLSSPSFASSVHGIVVYFNSNDSNCLSSIDDWLILLKEYEADIKIIVCPQCEENPKDGIGKREVQEWCLKNNFELVELNPITEEGSDDESDFAETTGIKRISQALEANVWPNLTMKDRKEPTSMSGLLNGGRCESTGSDHDSMASGLTKDNIEPSLEDLEGEENVDFSTLFSQLASMKEKASCLSNEERKNYAEKLVISYWKAIGGDDDEIFD